ncbi:GNAT family N-acetyltransferase [Guggenheimella bovis]
MIRLANTSDRDAWVKLNTEFIHFEYEDENVWEDPLGRGDIGEVFDMVLENEESPNHIFMIEYDGKVVGFMNSTYFYGVWAHGKVLYVDDFFLSEEYRGKGYGKRAINELIEWLKENGYKRLQLMAELTNPKASKFYEKEAFDKQTVHFFCKYL